MTKQIDTSKLSHTTETGMRYTACCTLADCSHETNNEEQKIKNAKRGEFKICPNCKNSYPATLIYFHAQKRGKYGLRNSCKECSKLYRKQHNSKPETKIKLAAKAKEWRLKNPEKSLELSRQMYKKYGHNYNSKKRDRLKTDVDFRNKIIEREKRYKESGRRFEMNNKPEMREAARLRSKKRRDNEELKKHDYNKHAVWVENNKEHLKELWKTNREELKPAYVAQTMRISINELTPEILETKRIIIKLKRELRSNNIKIR